jgi:transketolase
MASGSEVQIALAAAEMLSAKGIAVRVVSMPSWELFDRQTQDYRSAVLPPEVRARVAVEAGSPQGWHRFVGLDGAVTALERFGASAPYEVLYKEFGLTAEKVAEEALRLVDKDIKT